MKTFRLIVASRLAIFPLVFNFSIAQEAEVNTEGFEENEQISIDSSEPHPDPLLLGEGTWNVLEWQVLSEVDSSELAPQNDSLLSSWTEGEGSYVWIDDFNIQDSSLRSEWQEDA